MPYLFLAPSLAGTAVFVLIPFLDVVRRSFLNAIGQEFVGFKNFITVLEKEAFRLALFNTARFLLVCLPLLLLLSLLLALMISSAGGQAGIFKLSLLLPMAVPVASIVLLWKLVFDKQGFLNQLLALFGAPGADWIRGDTAFPVLIFTYLWKNAGYDMILWLAGLGSIPKTLYEAARVDGAGAWARFRYVTLPGLHSVWTMILLLSTVNSFKVFREAYLIAGDYPDTSIYLLQHLFNNWFVTLDIQNMSAAAVMLELMVLLPVIVWYGRKRKK